MSVKSQPVPRSYRINNAWLDANQLAGDYVDIEEIRSNPNSSAYLTWCIANSATTGITSRAEEQRKAQFTYTGFASHDTDNGDKVMSVLKDDLPNTPVSRQLTGGIAHGFNIRRVYSRSTQARELEFIGY